MSSWREMNAGCLEEAKLLLAAGHLRGSLNRAYYAAYCTVSANLVERGIRFARGWNNPAHDQLLPLIRNGLVLTPSERRQLGRSIRRLRLARENADYRPAVTIAAADAIGCLHDSLQVAAILEKSR